MPQTPWKNEKDFKSNTPKGAGELVGIFGAVIPQKTAGTFLGFWRGGGGRGHASSPGGWGWPAGLVVPRQRGARPARDMRRTLRRWRGQLVVVSARAEGGRALS